MSFLSSLRDLEETSNSLIMNEHDLLDPVDTCACPTAVELSKAVSVSLGLDSVSSPLNNISQCSTSAFADCNPTCGNSSRGAPELGEAVNMNSQGSRLLLNDINLAEGDFGEVCHHGIQQVSCMDLLRSSEMDSAQTVTRGPVISRYVCKESNLFMNPAAELPTTSQMDELLSLKPYPNMYRDSLGVWCANERANSSRSEPSTGGSGGHNLLCKYCNCGQASFGASQDCRCAWYSKGEQGGKIGVRAEMAQGYGQVESYQSAFSHSQATCSTIKTEPPMWIDCTDRSFR